MKKLSFTFLLWSLIHCLLLAQPIADFSVDNSYSCNLPMTVQFTNNSSGPNGLTYFWDLADGNTSMESDPTHIYDSYSNYEVCLYVTDDLTGLKDTACQMIVLEAMQSNFEATICAGEIYNLNGIDYNSTGSYSEVIPAGAFNGCDSLLILDLIILEPSIGMETYVGCEGDGYTVLVNGTIYNETNPIGLELLAEMSSAGCDSTVTIDLIFDVVLPTNIFENLCVEDNMIINGNIYDISNSMGTEVMSSITGCDSIINVNLNFYDAPIFNLDVFTCPGGSVEVNGIVYDEANPTGQELIEDGSFYGCDSTVIVTLNFNPEIIITPNVTNLTCFGATDGVINLDVIGGSGNYTYNWSNGMNSAAVIGISSGTYTVTVTDSEGCIAISTINLLEPFQMAVTGDITNNGCGQTCDGTIDIIVSGGTLPYAFLWNNGVSTEDNFDLCNGIYSVTITDANGCSLVSDIFDIVNEDELNVSSEDLEITCLVSNVVLDPIINGGVTPYNYQWSNGVTTTTTEVNSAGIYEITVTDNLGCMGIAIFEVTESLDEPSVFPTVMPTCIGGNTGSIVLELDATCPVNIEWSDGFSLFTEIGVGVGGAYTLIDNALAGTYSVTITDPCNGCSYAEDYSVDESPEITGTFSEESGVYCPGEDVQICFNPDIAVISYLWSWPNGFTSTDACVDFLEVSVTDAGCYELEVTDVSGCSTTFTNCISVYEEIVTGPNLDICLGDSVQIFTVPTNANITSINWTPDDGTLSCTDCLAPYASPAIAANYEVVIEYSTGCFQSANFEVGVDPSCVWPGDTDTNKVVNNFDLLAIGLSFDSIGPIRPNANIGWFGQPGPAWMQTTPGTDVDLEHVDTDGNGMINADDTMAIVANWGDEHMFTAEGGDYQFTNDEIFSEVNAENAPFYVSVDTFIEGETVGLPIILGDVGVPISDLYGIGFSIEYDSAIVDASSAFVVFDMSWLGLNNDDMITIQKDFHSPGRIDVALTKINGTPTTGFGELARLYITVEDNIFFRPDDTRSDELGINALFNIVDYMLITKEGEIIEVEPMSTTSLVRDVSTTTTNPKLDLLIDLFPNPTNDDIFVTTKNIEIENIQIYNLMGQMISNWIPQNVFSTKLPTHVLAQGSYLVKVQTKKGIWTERLVVVKK